MNQIFVERKTVIALLGEEDHIRIPRYQRSYSWEKENWSDLWEDILLNSSEKSYQHFLGTLIFCDGESGDGDGVELVDGQQRMITVTIMLRVLHDVIPDDSDKQSELQKYSIMYECIKGSVNDGSRNKLTLGRVDADFFRENFQDRVGLLNKKGKLKSEKRMIGAYNFFLEKINEYAKEREILLSKAAIEIYDALKRLVVIKVKVASEAEAYTIFETINARGVDLAASDLLKNYILSNSGRHLNSIEDIWSFIQKSILENGFEINQYVRHFWISNWGKVREKELYKKIKEKLKNNEGDVLWFCQKMKDEVESYLKIFDFSISDTNAQKNIGKYLKIINKLGIKQAYPLILSVFVAGYSDDDISKILKKIVKISMQRSVSGKNPNDVEEEFCKQAVVLRDKTEYRIDEVLDALSVFEMDTEKFTEYFISDEVSEKFAKIVLEQVEESIAGSRPEKKITSASIEHIMPQTRSGAWAAIDADDYSSLVKRIGNLTLIGGVKNSKMQNGAFSEKKITMMSSDFAITRNIAEKYSQWGSSEIEGRSFELCEFVVKEIFGEPYDI